MRLSLVVVAAAVALSAAGCGSQIGDACVVSSDCDPNGNRLCIDSDQHGGYCTIQGCDYDTCPTEAVCVRFYTGSFQNEPCTNQSQCSLDELCTLPGFCAPRSAEIRYCMLKCSSDSDCRDGYECRTFEKMISDGGEPVLSPGTPVDAKHATKFCALKPAS